MFLITISQAQQAILKGDIVAFPTETVYGLGADATNDAAVAKIFALKKRPTFNPLIVHYPSWEEAQHGAVFNKSALKLAKLFWPGPLTLVLPKQRGSGISLLVTAGLDTIGIRVPAHPVAQEFLRSVGKPVAAPSANMSGFLSPTKAMHVDRDLGSKKIPILDGGDCPVGIESTIVDISGDVSILLRPGCVTKEALEEHLGPLAQRVTHRREGEPLSSPGQLEQHYAPRIPLRTEASYARAKEAFLGFGGHEHPEAAKFLNLSSKGDLMEAAQNLFAYLHELDDPAFEGIAVAPIPQKGIGIAINDRLTRAAHSHL